MYAKAAPNVKMAENATTPKSEVYEKDGEPSRKLRIMSEAVVNGLISAKVTSCEGNLPVIPRSWIMEIG